MRTTAIARKKRRQECIENGSFSSVKIREIEAKCQAAELANYRGQGQGMDGDFKA